jgi:hypothetical protein
MEFIPLMEAKQSGFVPSNERVELTPNVPLSTFLLKVGKGRLNYACVCGALLQIHWRHGACFKLCPAHH